MGVGLILVSHSRELAAGVAQLAAQMAPAVPITPVGGTEDGGIGTSYEAIAAAVSDIAPGDTAVLLYDLGSALMTAEMVLELVSPQAAGRVRIVDAPLVEGALAAAVAAGGHGDIDEVVRAAAGAGSMHPEDAAVSAAVPGPDRPRTDSDVDVESDVSELVEIVNPLGLHARPAATLVRAVDGWDAQVSVSREGGRPVPLTAVLRVVALALHGGEKALISARGPDATEAVEVVIEFITSGFGEVPIPGRRISPVAMGALPARLGNAPKRRRAPFQPPAIVDGLLTAVPGVPGLAVGPMVVLDRAPVQLTGVPPAAGPVDPAVETARLDAAIREAERKLLVGNEFDIAHAGLLADPELRAVARHVVHRSSERAAAAWWAAVSARADELSADEDELVAARAVDLREAGSAVLLELGITVDRIPGDLRGAVVVSDDMGPGEVPVLLERGAVGVVLSASSATAHAVIVANGLGLPMVLRAGDELTRLPAGTELVLDGEAGTVRVAPSAEAAAAIRDRIVAEQKLATLRTEAAQGPVTLSDGRRILVVANVGSLADARAALEFGADGIGLLRTELLVLDRDTYPDEETQMSDLRAIFQVLGQRPIVVRLLDAGGDKPVTALDLDPVQNGFLGQRGLRYLLANPEILQTQLRAIFRAARGHHVSVMAPMVSVASEVVAFREAVAAVQQSLSASGVPFAAPERVGVMVEVPAAAVAADEICAECDFISIGSNDLASYLMAADRTVPEVADLLDSHSTALGRLLDIACGYATASGTPVAVCGEMAGLPDQAPALIARGVHELSIAPARIPLIKEVLRGL